MWLHRKQGPEKLKQHMKQAVRWSKAGRTTHKQRKYPSRQDHSKFPMPKNRIRIECFMEHSIQSMVDLWENPLLLDTLARWGKKKR